MIFKQIDEILSGQKTQTRRVVKPGPEAVETLRATLGALGGPYLFMAYDCKSLRPSVLKTEFKDRRDRMLTGGEG